MERKTTLYNPRFNYPFCLAWRGVAGRGRRPLPAGAEEGLGTETLRLGIQEPVKAEERLGTAW